MSWRLDRKGFRVSLMRGGVTTVAAINLLHREITWEPYKLMAFSRILKKIYLGLSIWQWGAGLRTLREGAKAGSGMRDHSKDQRPTPIQGNPASVFESLFPGLPAPLILSRPSQMKEQSFQATPRGIFLLMASSRQINLLL